MSHHDFIKHSLGIKEEHLELMENTHRQEMRNGRLCDVIGARLTHKPTHCKYCGVVAENNNIIGNGTFKSYPRLPKNSNGYDVRLELYKPRFLCKCCNRTFQLETCLIKPHCSISNSLKFSIFHDATFKRSEVEIAHNNHVSHSTVNRIINDLVEQKETNYNVLPAVLCFDEFKSTKHASAAMSFIYLDHEKKQILDIIEDRRLDSLISYFRRFTRKARRSVTHIVIDMYEPYVQLIKLCFPKAHIVCDKFHIVQHLNRALNQTRIAAMKRHKQHHRKFKRYWKLILMDSSRLNSADYRFFFCFKGLKSQTGVVDFIIGLDDELKATYHYYQRILYSIDKKKDNLLTSLLQSPPNAISDKMNIARKSLLKFLPTIVECLKTSYTNGPLEGTINQIKVIKRIAFGYRCFFHFKNRVLLIHNYNPIKLQRALAQRQVLLA